MGGLNAAERAEVTGEVARRLSDGDRIDHRLQAEHRCQVLDGRKGWKRRTRHPLRRRIGRDERRMGRFEAHQLCK